LGFSDVFFGASTKTANYLRVDGNKMTVINLTDDTTDGHLKFMSSDSVTLRLQVPAFT